MTDTINNMPTKTQDDVALQRIRTRLVRLMLFSIIITFVLVGLVLAAIIYKIMAAPQPPTDRSASAQDVARQQIDLMLNGHIVSYRLSGDVLTIHSKVRDKNPAMGDEFIFYDYRQGRILSRLKFFSPSE